jgi:hypothetical protein
MPNLENTAEMWLRHSVTEWHLDCEIGIDEKHDYLASVERPNGNDLILLIPSAKEQSKRIKFRNSKDLNEYLQQIGLEEVKL